MDYQKLGPLHKSMMAMLKRMTAKKNPDELRQEDREMLETYGSKVDFTDRESIAPLIDFMRRLQA
jgi:hypothetical protein